MQRQADVLINIANDDMTQIPGKFYEYLGSGRPILHLSNASEPVAEAIVRLRRGWVCANTHEAIRGQLAALVRAKADSREGLFDFDRVVFTPDVEDSKAMMRRPGPMSSSR